MKPAQIQKLLREGRVRVDRGARDTVRVAKGIEEWTFNLGSDRVWRYGYRSSYGRGEFVYGDGCDASGQPLKGAVAKKLSAIVEAQS